MIINKEDLSKNFQFISLFVALYESLSDYIIDCPKQLLNDDSFILKDATEEIENKEKYYKKKQEDAKKYLDNIKNKELLQYDFDDIETIANFGYTKKVEDGFVKWNSPYYNKLIVNRTLSTNCKPNILLKSLMFLVDEKAIIKEDFDNFIQIRDIRNKLVHKMPSLITTNVYDTYILWFNKLVNLYMRINNHWSVGFELGIGGEDIPPDIEIDYDDE